MLWTTTGTVMRKMMSSTSMTSTSGVVLMSDIGVSSPLSLGPTLMAIVRILSWHHGAKPAGTGSSVPAGPSSDLLRTRVGGADAAAGGGGAAGRGAAGRGDDLR